MTSSAVPPRAATPTGDAPDAQFPVRVAVVDIGSNAIRFTAAEFLDRKTRQDLEYHRVPIRLGQSAFLTGELTEENMVATVEAMASFRRRVDTFGVRDFRAVATSAVRESRNGGDLCHRVRQESGIRIDTITGSEEARLVWLAVRNRFPLDGRWMLMDLGGGSLELSAVTGEAIEWSESHTMGTVRLLEDLGGNADSPGGQEKLHRLLEEYAKTLRVSVPDGAPVEGLIATGGNIEELADLAGCERDDNGVSVLPLSELAATNERLAEMSYQERIDRLGLRPDRSDVIIPAGLLYHRVASVVGADRIVVPHVGVADGALFDLVEHVTTHRRNVDRKEQEIDTAARALGRKFRFDEAHARQVARLSLDLFDQLEAVHDLGDEERRILLGAALLHDIGQFVSYRKHHKHSLYLIRHSELSVFSPDEISLVGLVARYHRRAHPKEKHDVWSDLEDEDRTRVARLAALLRVGDALDREHLQKVSDVELHVSDHADEVVIEVHAHGDLLLELWALEKKGVSFFQEIYGRTPRIEIVDDGELPPRSSPGSGAERRSTTRGTEDAGPAGLENQPMEATKGP